MSTGGPGSVVPNASDGHTGADAAFYRRHYAGGVETGAMAPEVFEREMLMPGKRYSLMMENLTRENTSGRIIAEVGCGGAEALKIISERYNFAHHIGVDIAASAGSADKWRASRIEIINANLNERWPFTDGQIDCLAAMMVIEHLFDPFQAFQEITRCVAKDGAAYVNLPLVTGIRNRMRLLFGNVPITSTRYASWFSDREWDGNHLHYFSIQSVTDLARACGLRVTGIRGVGRFHGLKSRIPALLASEATFRLEHL